ncbi:remorin 1.4-like isoform X2 [Salvia splendens]|uniref:remorin 1.4-like isoform X2 n=1 Tax=Salvia splendens TaxID=180675 RepID=UPI001C251FAD|nr:remorin 1.4-like isoform X2 [Salvia splendens]
MGEETKSVNGKDESTAAATVLSAEEKADDSEKPITQFSLQDSQSLISYPPPTSLNAVLAKVEIEKKFSLIKAWEENEKTKAENKAHKKLSAIDAWENTKRAAVEAELKQIEEKFEKKKTEYAEKMKNKEALIHKAAEEKRATIEENRSKDSLNAEEMAAKYRTTATIPKKSCACFTF